MAIFRVRITAPEVNEEVILAAENAEEAERMAVASCVNRVIADATVTVEEMPPAGAD